MFKSIVISSDEVSLCWNNYETRVENTDGGKILILPIFPAYPSSSMKNILDFTCMEKPHLNKVIIWLQKGKNFFKN